MLDVTGQALRLVQGESSFAGLAETLVEGAHEGAVLDLGVAADVERHAAYVLEDKLFVV